MNIAYIKNITPFSDINEILYSFVSTLHTILNDNLIGVYLLGSLTYGNFKIESSDIDLQVLLKNKLTVNEIELIQQLHSQIAKDFPQWAKRIECSYVPLDTLTNILPPLSPRPYYGEDILYPEAPYGNEWIINQYMLYQHGIALIGPEYKTLISPIDFVEVQKACIRDLLQEWQPKISDQEWLANSHYQSYLVLNLCRILYTVIGNELASKKVSAAWVKNHFAPQWRGLIEIAEQWQYGLEMRMQNEAIQFINFVIDEITKLPLYHEAIKQ